MMPVIFSHQIAWNVTISHAFKDILHALVIKNESDTGITFKTMVPRMTYLSKYYIGLI
jgi:hypothetical protein